MNIGIGGWNYEVEYPASRCGGPVADVGPIAGATYPVVVGGGGGRIREGNNTQTAYNQHVEY